MTDLNPESHRILVVDDSSDLLLAVKTVLEDVGYQVCTSISGEEALELISAQGLPHLALVDINMPPGMDGFEFCQAVHQYSDLPVVMLTAVAEEDTIVEAIELYAEDYITKPFSLDELLVRVGRVMRRIGEFACPLNSSQPVDPFLTVDFPHYQATVDGNLVPLTPTETKLLYILMRSAGQAVSTDFILRRLWPQDASNENRLRVYLHRLRKKLKVKEPEHNYIRSRRGVGYCFTPYSST